MNASNQSNSVDGKVTLFMDKPDLTGSPVHLGAVESIKLCSSTFSFYLIYSQIRFTTSLLCTYFYFLTRTLFFKLA